MGLLNFRHRTRDRRDRVTHLVQDTGGQLPDGGHFILVIELLALNFQGLLLFVELDGHVVDRFHQMAHFIGAGDLKR